MKKIESLYDFTNIKSKYEVGNWSESQSKCAVVKATRTKFYVMKKINGEISFETILHNEHKMSSLQKTALRVWKDAVSIT